MQLSDFTKYLPQKMFIVSGDEGVFETLLASAQEEDPFTYGLSVPRLTIDHARDIATFLCEGTGEKRIYIVYFTVFSPEAAQVLLKSLEEPDMETTLIFVTPHPYTVPQTIRSRVLLITNTFVQGTLPFKTKAEALAFIKENFGGDAEEDAATKRSRAVHLLNALETAVSGSPLKAKSIYEAKDMLYNANMPTKYVLEFAVTMAL